MKNKNFVNLNINPCKMCMPMGAVLALKGIKNSMMVLHGSQGCSTYIRRHMAGHYDEPIDIASTSLNEHGTVYGGESNLKKALNNIIKLYSPEVIGVATTCLAETIGEDISRIVSEFEEDNQLKENIVVPRIIPIATPGYGGTQFEGYFTALTSILKTFTRRSKTNNKINIIVPNINSIDVRNIKSILEAFKINFIMFPDVSETLDAPYKKDFSKIPRGGTSQKDIQEMSGAVATIEMGMTVPDNISPGKYLKDTFDVPLYKCTVPVGLRNTDKFLNIVSEITGKKIPKHLQDERGRMLDGMIDSHKHNAEGRAVIYGEPEECLYLSGACIENGIKPVLISTGSQNKALKNIIEKEMEVVKDLYTEEDMPLIIDDTDFETIQKLSVELNANILIGNSDGKYITEKEGIPLIRSGFPIHDRVGGNRILHTGYEGTMRFIDSVTNTLLEHKYENYRERMFDSYFINSEGGDKMETEKEEPINIPINSIEEKTKSHPCYSSGACKNARMHIPVAPACNISCNYCNRKFDCVNESRPGVTSEILTPEQALEKFKVVSEKLPNLKVVGIAGPGDALANFEQTKKSIQLIKKENPEITFCLSTNGLMLPRYAEELVKLGVTHVTVTINSIDPKIGEKIYKEINYLGKKYTGVEAAEILQKNQLEGLELLAGFGVMCKVNVVMLKGINDDHIHEVVKKVKTLGAFMTNIMPLIPAEGSEFEDMPLTSNKELNTLRKKCEIDLKQMYHCKQCRADAIGMLAEDRSIEFRLNKCGGGCSTDLTETIEDETESLDSEINHPEYTVALASKTGMIVDQHFGHAERFSIYKYTDNQFMFLEEREVSKYCNGEDECDEESKIDGIINVISDCDAVIVMRIGHSPTKMLEKKGISVIQTCQSIKESLELTRSKFIYK